ncbi:MAG: hypothetical protein ACSLEY_01020 [Candidatus Saccharimonadales bacterium]
MPKSTQRHLTHVHTHPSSSKTTLFDKLVFGVSLLYPLSALPQVFDIFYSNSEGVSILSWTIFMLCSALFLAYGLKHKVPPMIVSNSLWVVVDGLVITGLLLKTI